MRELTYFPLPGGTYYKSSPYGWRTNPVTGRQGTFHRGVDYAVASGTPVYAPFDGNVSTGYEAGGAGNWSWVVNGPDMFKSFHHSGFAVRSGWVQAGQVIAYIGTTGSSTGAHMHAELWSNGVNIDPTGYLDRAPVKGSAPSAPVPSPEEDEEVKSYIMWNDQGAYEVWGIFKRALSGEDVNALRFLGVEDKGHVPQILVLKTEVPRGMMN